MQNKNKKLSLACGAALGLLLTASLFLVSYAQKKTETQNVKIETEQEIKARQEVAKSVAGNLFLDSITAKETRWKLKEAYHSIKHSEESSNRTVMSFGAGDDIVNISISEYSSAKHASESSSIPRSMGASVNFNTYGDQGEKIYLEGNFIALRFRQGNFVIRISAKNEKTAERFAVYAVEAVKNFALK